MFHLDLSGIITAGSLIFFAGQLTQTVRDHDRRIGRVEKVVFENGGEPAIKKGSHGK